MKNFVAVLFFAFVLCVPANAQVDSGVVNGKAINLVKPEYPSAAKAVGAGGNVNVQVTIDEQGKVVTAKAVSGHPLLKESCEKAALESTFAPALLSGQAVKVTGVVVYNFVADKKTNPALENTEKNYGKVLNSKAVILPKPEYPAAAKAIKAQGAVIVEITVDKQGNVISAEAVDGHELLRKSSEKAALKAKFKPTIINGKAVKTKGVLVYKFYVH